MSTYEDVDRTDVYEVLGDLLTRVQILEALSMRNDPYLTYQKVNGGGDDEAVILAEPGVVYGWYISNADLDFVYVKLYNKATTPVLGTDASQETLGVPPELGANQMAESGIEFDTGIGIAISNSPLDSASTNPPADTVVVNILYLPAA